MLTLDFVVMFAKNIINMEEILREVQLLLILLLTINLRVYEWVRVTLNNYLHFIKYEKEVDSASSS
jgi:hypothetical protein